ncbi:integrase core domain-containing protein [Pantoea agglomerans]
MGQVTNDWQKYYSKFRPHSALNQQTPSELATRWRSEKYKKYHYY